MVSDNPGARAQRVAGAGGAGSGYRADERNRVRARQAFARAYPQDRDGALLAHRHEISYQTTNRRSIVKKAASIARLTPDRAVIIRIGRALLDAKIQLAYRDGYIGRIREIEELPPRDTTSPDPDAIEKLRRIMSYSPDKEASQILEAISPDLLDRVLGKPGDADG